MSIFGFNNKKEMENENKLIYLESERLKIWERLSVIEELVSKKTSDYESEAMESAKRSKEIFLEIKAVESKTNEQLKVLQEGFNKSTEQLVKNETLNTEITDILTKIKASSKKVEQYYENVTDKNSKIETLFASLDKLFESKSSTEDKIKILDSIYSKANENDTKINALLKTISDRKKEIDEVYFDIIGYTETDVNGNQIEVEGKKIELEAIYNNLKNQSAKLVEEVNNIKLTSNTDYSEFKNQAEKEIKDNHALWSSDIEALKAKIVELLPNALTAGLSYAYSEKKSSEILENARFNTTFKYAIWGLIAVSLIPFAFSLYSIIQSELLETVIYRIPRIVLAITPLYLPILWVAYSASKKINLSKRLIEEYSHKEVLSKTFEGLSRQIIAIEDKSISEDLKIKLLYNILEVNSENPGKLISDYNNTDHPLMDALDKSIKLTNAVSRLAKIPGFSKLVSTLQKKSDTIIEVETKKAEAGLETLDSKV